MQILLKKSSVIYFLLCSCLMHKYKSLYFYNLNNCFMPSSINNIFFCETFMLFSPESMKKI